jgi:NAD(P)-dependent dehydrogenase (short-subunit alcohol dehydrogenase family)
MEKKQVVLITGSSRGFGYLASKTLALAGYTVFASMRDPGGRNAAARDQLIEVTKRQELKIVDLDVCDDASVERAVNEVISDAGHIDVLVNNAGFSIGGITEAFSLEQVRRLFETNFFGVVRMNRAVAPHMRHRGKGLILHVGSTSGRSIFPGMGMYAATKFALEALAEAYRYDLSSFGVDSVILEPGPYDTDVFSNNELPADIERLKDYEKILEKMSQMYKELEKQYGDPRDVAEAIVRIIETPPGERPLRQIVGGAVPQLYDLNEASNRVQREIFEYFGIRDWLGISPSPERGRPLRFGWGGGRKPL